MPLLQVRNFPAELYERLRHQAQAERRSVAQQTVVLLEQALEDGESARVRRVAAFERLEAMSAPVLSLDPVDVIRQDRDTR